MKPNAIDEKKMSNVIKNRLIETHSTNNVKKLRSDSHQRNNIEANVSGRNAFIGEDCRGIIHALRSAISQNSSFTRWWGGGGLHIGIDHYISLEQDKI